MRFPCRSAGRGGNLIVSYGTASGRQRRRCTNRCTKSNQPRPVNATVADYRTCNRLILSRPASELPTVTAEVASSSLVVPAILFKGLNEFHCTHFRQLEAFPGALLFMIWPHLCLGQRSLLLTQIRDWVRLPVQRASLARWPACRRPTLNVATTRFNTPTSMRPRDICVSSPSPAIPRSGGLRTD